MDVTVAICTYNGEPRLNDVFERLSSQKVQPSTSWNILVVDNNSQDRTAEVVRQYQLSNNLGEKIQYLFEARQGLAFARRCAVRAAQGHLIAFLDDDNLPDPHWVQSVYDFGQQHSDAGAFGSQIVGAYEGNPPENFDRIACFLAVIDRGDKPFRYDLLDHWLFPAGAGLVVSRQAWLAAVPATPRLSGVAGRKLTGKGEDIETLSYLRKAGWQIWHNPGMKIEHVIGCDRMSPKYLLSLFRGVGLSRYHTRMVKFECWQRPFALVAYGLNDLRRWLSYYLTRYQVPTSLVEQCELTLLYYSLLSPVYVLIQWLRETVSLSYWAWRGKTRVDSS